jgi:uncharacterized protein (TIGR00269 family)
MNIEQKVKETIEKYDLLDKKNDRVLVALSGGKDSTSVLYILHKLGYNVSGLMIDLHLGEWSEIHKRNMIEFCKELGIKLEIADLQKEFGHGICFIKDIVKKQKKLSGCTVCGVIKKWILNKWAKNLKVTKLVTGHNLDDEAQTVLMNFLKGNLFLGINSKPMTGEKHAGFIQRVKPLFFVPEAEIRKYAKEKKFKILYERCPCAIGTYRVETRAWLDNFSDEEKLKIVSEFQKQIPKLKRKCERQIKECELCGEPASNSICNACNVLSCLKGI